MAAGCVNGGDGAPSRGEHVARTRYGCTVPSRRDRTGGHERREFTADVKPGGFVAVDVTTLR